MTVGVESTGIFESWGASDTQVFTVPLPLVLLVGEKTRGSTVGKGKEQA